MSVAQNLSYAIVQVVHNLGAIAAVGGSFAATSLKKTDTRKKLAWLALAGWGTQAASGAAFGAVSYYFYHRFPDISGVAIDALMIKMACVAAGLLLLSAYLAWGANWPEGKIKGVYIASFALAITALCAAAFLRWFS
jgi:hypothetical protein